MTLFCIIIDASPKTDVRLKKILEKHADIHLLHTFIRYSDALEFLKKKGKVDIIFCDINSVHTTEPLKDFCDFLIYVAPNINSDIEVFAHKNSSISVNNNTFIHNVSSIKRLRRLTKNKENDQYIYVKGDYKSHWIKVFVKDIQYISAESNYISIYLNTDKTIMTYMPLWRMDSLLERFGHFYRISRSIIINLHYLIELKNNTALLENGKLFNIGKTYINDFHAFIYTKAKRLNV